MTRWLKTIPETKASEMTMMADQWQDLITEEETTGDKTQSNTSGFQGHTKPHLL